MSIFAFRAYLARPHDGDSFWVMTDLGFGARAEPELRLLDVHAPELSEPGGAETTEFVNAWFGRAAAAQRGTRWPLYVATVPTGAAEPGQRTSLSRFLATVWRYDQRPDCPAAGHSLNDAVNGFLAGHPEWGHGR